MKRSESFGLPSLSFITIYFIRIGKAEKIIPRLRIKILLKI